MAIYRTKVKAELSEFSGYIEKKLAEQSTTFTVEHTSEVVSGDAHMKVVACERFSWLGSSRVSLTLSYLARDGWVDLVATSTGGSQAMFFKVNTWGEENFLQTLTNAVQSFNVEHGREPSALEE